MHDSDANAPTHDRPVDALRADVAAGTPIPDPAPPAEGTPHGETTAESPTAAPAAEPTPTAEPIAVAEATPVAEQPAVHEPAPAGEPSPEDRLVLTTAPVTIGAPVGAIEATPDTGLVPTSEPATIGGPADAAPADAPLAAEGTAAETAPADTPATDAAVAGTPAAADGQAPPQPKGPSNDERRARAQQVWEHVVAAKESGEVLTGTVTSAVKGGLLVDVDGVRGFLPASQTRVPAGGQIEALVKTKVPLKVIDIDAGRRRIVVSQRRALQEERGTKRRELLASLAVGQVREGIVVRLADFGAFVDLGGIDGLIPMRELAFERVEKTADVVTVGEKLNVEVLRIEENGKKISLSRKNALPDPWRDHAKLLQRGATIEGKVVSKERGLTVEIAPGVSGNVREDEINPDDYAIGETVEVSVRNVDRVRRRINLTTLHGAQATAIASAAPSSSSSGFAPLGAELLNPKPRNRRR